jgi:hypothetical protein
MTSATWRETVYGNAADRYERGPHLNELATGRAANLTAGWGLYNGQTIPIYDERGNRHMITPKMHKVYLWAMTRIAADDCNTSMRKAALELGVCVQTVSNTLRRMMAWGKLGYLSSKGRYGGITLFGRFKGDGLERYARMALDALRAFWERRLSTKSNVHTYVRQGTKRVSTSYLSSSVDIRIRRDDEIEGILVSQQRGAMKRVPCPAHGGEDRNLSFWRRPDGSLGVKCWSHQCTEREVKDALVPWSPMDFRKAGMI